MNDQKETEKVELIAYKQAPDTDYWRGYYQGGRGSVLYEIRFPKPPLTKYIGVFAWSDRLGWSFCKHFTDDIEGALWACKYVNDRLNTIL